MKVTFGPVAITDLTLEEFDTIANSLWLASRTNESNSEAYVFVEPDKPHRLYTALTNPMNQEKR
jgi:hypothetical protein